MPFIIPLFLFLSLSTTKAIVQTDTHTYLVDKTGTELLVIDRKSGEEKRISVGQGAHEIVIHNNKGYVVNQYDGTVSVIDLLTHEPKSTFYIGKDPYGMEIHKGYGYISCRQSADVYVICLRASMVYKRIPVLGTHPDKIVIHEGFGYVSDNQRDIISVINLDQNCVEKTLIVPGSPDSVVIYKGLGYVVQFRENAVSIIDLQQHEIVKTIAVGHSPIGIHFYRNSAFVVNGRGDSVSVICLETDTVLKTIQVGKYPQRMVIFGAVGYVPNFESNTLSVIDLDSLDVISTLFIKPSPGDILTYKGYGYIIHPYNRRLTIIDLELNEVIEDLPFERQEILNFSDTHLYRGLTKDRPLPGGEIRLFKNPYDGINGFYYGVDQEAEFRKFFVAMHTNDRKTARIQFEILLAIADPKAFSIGVFAFLHGKWGAPVHMKWAHEFVQGMDLGYYHELCNNNPL